MLQQPRNQGSPAARNASPCYPARVNTKPRQIKWFIGLQCLALAVSPLVLYLNWAHTRLQSAVVSIGVLLFITALLALLIWRASQGKNWARITLLVLFLIGLLPFAFTVRSEFSRSVGLASLSVLQAALQGASLVILFTRPVNPWFRRAPQPSPQS
jgi:phosphatidylserine synthase